MIVVASRDQSSSAPKAASRVSEVSHTWMVWRLARGAKASTSVPTSAPPTTTSIGATAA